MQTAITADLLNTPEGREADAILRSCVHCGFCTATCPTYQLLGDELDGPRGRIYLIKQVMEGGPVTRETQLHLDRCLTCRSCESTCPSGVAYGHLADIGRHLVERRVARPLGERLGRGLLRAVLPYPVRLGSLVRAGRAVKDWLPDDLGAKVPPVQEAGPWPAPRHPRRMLVLAGCAQSVTTPRTNAALARVLDRLGVSLGVAKEAGCCGAVDQHLSAPAAARRHMRRNIDAWWPQVEAGAEAILVSASGCGAMVKDYGRLLAEDPAYAAKAARIAALARDPVEVLETLDLAALGLNGAGRAVAFHAPCTLQHGQKVRGRVESILGRLGFRLTPVANPHLCCGSAGTYSILQPELSLRLRADKLAALEAGEPEVIATANVGCQLHLAGAAGVAVVHWLELLDDAVTA